MNSDFIYNLLVDPVSGEKMMPDRENGTLKNLSGKPLYQTDGEIPVIIVSGTGSMKQPEIHGRYKTSFNYQEHYHNDAMAFDYSGSSDSAATRSETKRLHETILNKVPLKSGLMLDAGCGNGWVAAAMIPRGWKVVSMDISSVNPAKAIQRTPHENHAAVAGDVFNPPFGAETFDCIIACEIMEHLQDPERFIKNLSGLLKPGGILLITTPYREKIEYSLCVHCNRLTPHNAHLHSFDEISVSGLLPREGFISGWFTFSNKFLSRMRINILLGFLPYKIWKLIDSLMNTLTGNRMRIMILITRE